MTRTTRGDFGPFGDKMREAGLPAAAIRSFGADYEKLASGSSGTISESEIDPVGALPHQDELAEHAGAGRDFVRRTAVIKLNGGLGTSMGMRAAKSLLPVKGEFTFLDLIARQVLHLREAYGGPVPLVLMDSFRTRDDSLERLAAYPELAHGGLPLDFLQHKVPRIRADDLTPVEWPTEPDLEWCPPGHGDLYLALSSSGMLASLRKAGCDFAFVSNSDNLGAVLDPALLGWMACERIPFVMEVCRRTPTHRKGGHLARFQSGELVLREIAQCPEGEEAAFQDIDRHSWFNTNNLWIDLRVLERVLEEREGVLGLPMIRNEKRVDANDSDSPRVIQLETAMGAAISVFPGARAVHVAGDRFAPVKSTADLLTVWSDAYELYEDWRIVPAADAGLPVVDLDPGYYKGVDQLTARFPAGAPSLVGCRGLRVEGDVTFGRDVTCRGDVELTAAHAASVPDGAVLEGSTRLD
ncbi:MAG: UTP--glucose-1-phosphate uridylyltransferase [Myxococcota bacterium]